MILQIYSRCCIENGQEESKEMSNVYQTSKDATLGNKGRNYGDLDQKHGDGVRIETLFDSEYILNIEL